MPDTYPLRQQHLLSFVFSPWSLLTSYRFIIIFSCLEKEEGERKNRKEGDNTGKRKNLDDKKKKGKPRKVKEDAEDNKRSKYVK